MRCNTEYRYFASFFASDPIRADAVEWSINIVFVVSLVMVVLIEVVTLNPTLTETPRTFVQIYAESMVIVTLPELVVTFAAEVCPPWT